MNSKKLLNCIACGGVNIVEVINFGDQPLANSFLEERSDNLDTFPLVINYCNDCTHCQLSIAVDPSLLFAHYLYVSGTTDTLKKHFNEISDTIKNLDNVKNIIDYKNINHVKILDIGSNDNTFLNVLKSNQFVQLYGVDPASNINKTNNIINTNNADHDVDI